MRIGATLFTAATILALAGPAHALTIDYSTNSSALDTYFAGTDYEIYGGFLGNVPTGGWLPFTAPGIDVNFSPIANSISLSEGNPDTQIVNAYVRAPEVNFAHPGFGPSDSATLQFTFTIDSPAVVGSNSVVVSYAHDIQIIANSNYSSLFTLNSPNVASFDLGAEGILDVTFLTPPRLNSGGGFNPHGIGFNATFLLRDVSARIPEPGTLMLMGAGLIGLGFVRRRRTA